MHGPDASYMRKWRDKRRDEAFQHLGGKCIKCKSVKDLQFDHIDPKRKQFPIAKIWTSSKETFFKELNKCQILCHSCHKNKTALEMKAKRNPIIHGTVYGYTSRHSPCRCSLCTKAMSEYAATRRKIRGRYAGVR